MKVHTVLYGCFLFQHFIILSSSWLLIGQLSDWNDLEPVLNTHY